MVTPLLPIAAARMIDIWKQAMLPSSMVTSKQCVRTNGIPLLMPMALHGSILPEVVRNLSRTRSKDRTLIRFTFHWRMQHQTTLFRLLIKRSGDT
jgi:hypothetical protein